MIFGERNGDKVSGTAAPGEACSHFKHRRF